MTIMVAIIVCTLVRSFMRLQLHSLQKDRWSKIVKDVVTDSSKGDKMEAQNGKKIAKLVKAYKSTYTEGNMQFDSSFWSILSRVNHFLPAGVKIDDFSKEDRDMIWNLAYLISCVKSKHTEVHDSDDTLTRMVKEIKKEAEAEIREHLEMTLHYLCFELNKKKKL